MIALEYVIQGVEMTLSGIRKIIVIMCMLSSIIEAKIALQSEVNNTIAWTISQKRSALAFLCQ